ncbi:MAG: nucleoside transporter [Candidatus Aminicenantes bacterium]|uniref:Nucleoside permease NupC n=1 Tax=Candidatus Saccharicenans subterraneus TaxID=2508984 RepID=A0A3E2BQH7_9BACT|nr:nucleoside transporter [Candidatus Aminicenantes bacterium]RFT16892.1 MAG: Nucleoside permease NupC [Candidatus Saccharicenans subterraneum]
MSYLNLVSFGGLVILALVAWLFSSNKKVVNWKVVGWGLGLQLLFAFVIFLVPAGGRIFLAINEVVVRVLDSATAGIKFLFGPLALPPGTSNESGETSPGFILAFQALPTVVFFAALVGALYYLKVMPLLIRLFARIFTRLMKISGAESLCVSSNIFVGVESSLVVRPYLPQMTSSELATILTAGMATIASSVLSVYVMILRAGLPTIAGHLVSASILSAPAALLTAKLMFPETEKPVTLGLDVKPYYEKEDNLIMAIINGAQSGLKLLGGIVALLLAFLGLLALLDLVLGWLGGHLNHLLGWSFNWQVSGILSYVFYPFALVMGVSPQDASLVARLLAERVVATELVSYQHLAGLLQAGAFHDPRSAIIASYALCGFAHVASLAIFVGGIGALAPSRLKDLSRLGLKALLAATLACLITGAVAGVFYTGSSVLFGR